MSQEQFVPLQIKPMLQLFGLLLTARWFTAARPTCGARRPAFGRPRKLTTLISEWHLWRKIRKLEVEVRQRVLMLILSALPSLMALPLLLLGPQVPRPPIWAFLQPTSMWVARSPSYVAVARR